MRSLLIILLSLFGCNSAPVEQEDVYGCPNNQIADDCGVCQTNEESIYWNVSCQDCNGEVGGYALIDDCGKCDSNYENDCIKDCNDENCVNINIFTQSGHTQHTHTHTK